MELAAFEVEFPLDLRATLSYLPGSFRADGWWRPLNTVEGPATIHLRRSDRGIEARAFGPGAESALATVPGLIGAEDKPEGLVTYHPIVGKLHRRHPGLRMAKTGSVFEILTIAILTQKVTGKEAGRSLRLLRRHFADQAPGPPPASGPPLRLPPMADRLAESRYYQFHPLGMEQRRTETLLRAARQAEKIETLSNEASSTTRAWLERIPGIGIWTSAETVSISHGDPDALAVGDFHLKNVISWHLAGRPRGTDSEMEALLEEFRPQRARVARLVSLLGKAPAYGPRMPIRSFAGY